uniref:BTG anti-proliferation factor 1 n=1 Tax=Gallus gallus TaxID=9031 RepID=A0A8V0YDQ9_CHICK
PAQRAPHVPSRAPPLYLFTTDYVTPPSPGTAFRPPSQWCDRPIGCAAPPALRRHFRPAVAIRGGERRSAPFAPLSRRCVERCRGRRCCRRPPAAGGGGGGCRPRDVIWVPPPIPHPVKAARAQLPSPAAPSGCPPAAPESWLPAAAASMHPALYTRASMIREIAAAVAFISKFLRTKGLMNERQLQTFSQSLQELLAGSTADWIEQSGTVPASSERTHSMG